MSLAYGGFASWEDGISPETILFPSLTPVRSLFRMPSPHHTVDSYPSIAVDHSV